MYIHKIKNNKIRKNNKINHKIKLMILKAKKRNLLNKRTEIISKCRYESRFYIKNFCRRKNAVTSSLSTYQQVTPRMLEIINGNQS